MQDILSLSILLLTSIWTLCDGHSVYMTQSQYCSLALNPGTNIMGSSAVTSSSRSVVVRRGSTTLTSGATYNYGETLTVSLSSTSGEYVLQTSGGTFTGGGCTGTRVANSAGSLVMPSSGSASISIKGGWANSRSTVSISNSFVLNAPVVTNAPTALPTIVPSAVITTTPSASPSTAPAGPTFSPTTRAPTFTASPTAEPTASPTVSPTTALPTSTAVPTSESGVSSAGTSKKGELSSSKANKLVIGLVVGGFGAGALFALGHHYVTKVESGEIDSEKSHRTRVKAMSGIASVLAIVTIVLMSLWARRQNNSKEDFSYLGEPSAYRPEGSNIGIFAWHPVLMVCGLVVGQIFAVATWALAPRDRRHEAKLVHVMFQTAALICMVFGLAAIIIHQEKVNAQSFTTIHSIVGIASIALFSLNYFWGMTMWSLLNYLPGSLWRKHIDLRKHHRKIGAAAMLMTLLATLTGIMNQLPMGVCYSTTNMGRGNRDSADNYPDMPNSCQIGLGAGITVSLAVFLVLYAASERGEDWFTSTSSAAFAVAPSNDAKATAAEQQGNFDDGNVELNNT